MTENLIIFNARLVTPQGFSARRGKAMGEPYDRKPDYIQRPPRHPAGLLRPPRQGNGRTAGAGQCHYRGDRRTHHLRRLQPRRRARRILPALLALQRPRPLRAARLRGLAHALHLRRRTGRGVRLAPAGRQLHGHHAPRRRHRQHRPGHPRLQLHPTAHPCRRPAETHVADGHHHRGGQERLRTGQGNGAAATQGDALPEPRRAPPRGHRPHLPRRTRRTRRISGTHGRICGFPHPRSDAPSASARPGRVLRRVLRGRGLLHRAIAPPAHRRPRHGVRPEAARRRDCSPGWSGTGRRTAWGSA